MTKRVECTVVRSVPLSQGHSVVSPPDSDPNGCSSIVPVSKVSQWAQNRSSHNVGVSAVGVGDDSGESGPSGPSGPRGIFGVYGPRAEVPRGLALDVAA